MDGGRLPPSALRKGQGQMRRRVLTRTLVGLALVFGALLARAGSAGAQDLPFSADLNVEKLECFHGVGPDIFEECGQNDLSGVTIFIGDFAQDTTGDDGTFSGTVSWDGSPTTTLTLAEDPDVLANYLGAYVYCRDLVDDEVLFDGSATDTGGVVTISIEDGDNIFCDWYNITEAPADSGGTTATSTPTTTTTTTTTLPSTGAGPTGGSNGSALLLMVSLATLVLGGAAVARRRRTAL
jgi:hypothetical protein